ncbi:MAG: ABC transporter permease [Actinobacteria bacterium]|nr:MAG: ABC transporter permease [Actinomycetota bacterium]
MTSDLHLAGWQLLYEQRSFWRNRARAFFALGFPLILLVTFCSLNQGGTVSSRGGIPIDTVFLPGILAYGVVMATFTNLAVETARLRDAGLLKRMQATPLPAWAYLAGRIGSAVTVALVIAAATIALGEIAYGVHVHTAALGGLALALIAGTACFTALGIGIVRIIPNADAAPAIVNAMVLPLTFISGVWGPSDGEPALLSHLAQAFPLEHLAAWLQLCFDPRTHGAAVSGGDLLALALWGFAGVRLTQRFLRVTMTA